MPQYQYQGFNSQGKAVKGLLHLDNVNAARSQLKKDGIYVAHIEEVFAKEDQETDSFKWLTNFFRRIPTEDLANMTRQLATLVSSHIPLVEALDALTEQIENERLRAAISRIRTNVNEGSPLNKALAQFPDIFSELYINMVASGETSGALDVVLLRLADFLEYQDRLKKKVMSSMAYPLLMILFGGAAILLIFTYVIPQLESVFTEAQQSLPMMTQVVLWISNATISYWWLMLFVLILLVFAVRYLINTPSGKQRWHALQLKLPIFGELVRMIAVSRFTKTLCTLLKSGIPLLVSLQVVRNVVGNRTIQSAIESATTNLTEGQSISGPLKRSGQFPPMVTHMVSVGERTGELENMLEKIAEHYEYQVNARIQNLTALLEPLMIIVLAAIVLVIVLSVILPMVELNTAVL